MKNTFGSSISVTLFGESHGEYIGACVDGLAPGLKIDIDFIKSQLALRRPVELISTTRIEEDEFSIVSGSFNGYTTGTPLTILIPNKDVKSADYDKNRFIARPGHADYTAYLKYHGFEDYRGGGHFSGRITAALVAVGAILISALKEKGIEIGTHISRLANVYDSNFSDYKKDFKEINSKYFATLSKEAEEKMKDKIIEASNNSDSVGGVLETVILGMPEGAGEPWFDSIESELSHILFSVPAVKGVEFGDGFKIADLLGSQANDSYEIKNGKVITKTNHNGGINGGISNGMPITVKTAIKPTPTIPKEQETVDFKNNKNTKIQSSGRHDPCIVPRARVVVDSVIAIALSDILTKRFGTDYLKGK